MPVERPGQGRTDNGDALMDAPGSTQGNSHAAKTPFVLEATGITKTFGGVTALDHVDLRLRRGEVLALVGDNGAGKSTLVKAITGATAMDSGSVRFDGTEVSIQTPADAKALGIETVYQDLGLVNNLSVTKNVFLGRELVRQSVFGRLLGTLDLRAMDAEVRDLFQRLGVEIRDLSRETGSFSGGQRQAVALSRTVLFGKKVAILDEPTAALGVKEAANAMRLVKSLKDHGLSVIMITHNMRQVLDYCDRVQVMRLGRCAAVSDVAGLTGDDLVGLITGATDARAA